MRLLFICYLHTRYLYISDCSVMKKAKAKKESLETNRLGVTDYNLRVRSRELPNRYKEGLQLFYKRKPIFKEGKKQHYSAF